MNFDDAIVAGEGFAANLETIAPEHEIAGDQVAGVVGREGTVKLDGVAGKFDGGLERKTVGAGDFEAKLSGVALRQQRESKQEDGEVEQRTHLSRGSLMLTASRDRVRLLRNDSDEKT